MHGAKDRLTSPGGSEEFYSNAGPNVSFHLLEELYHEIHNEPENNDVFQTQLSWIEDLLEKLRQPDHT